MQGWLSVCAAVCAAQIMNIRSLKALNNRKTKKRVYGDLWNEKIFGFSNCGSDDFSCAACSSDGNGDTTAAEGTTAADTFSDVIAAPANDDTTAPSETAAPAENGGNTASPAPADRNNNINIIIKPAGTAKPSAGGSSTVTPPKTDNTPVEVETDPKKIIVSAEKEWIFTEKITDSCHASTVLPLNDGSVIAAWFGGSSEQKNDVKIYTSVRTEEDGWSDPIVVSAADNVAHWNPVLFQKEDGTVVLYFKVGKTTEYWQTYYVTSTDGRSWSTPRELVPGDNSGGRGPVKNKPIRLKDGTVLAPASTEIDDKYRCFVDISNDDGETWTKTAEIDSKYCTWFKVPMIQPTLWQSADGSVHMFTRTKVGKIYRSDSYDNGKTWCRAYATKLPNNNSGIDLDTDDQGRIFLAYNNIGIPGIRTPLVLSVSTDDGKTFTKIKTFEKGLAEYSYPAVVVKGDTIHITYTYERDYIAYWQIKIK